MYSLFKSLRVEVDKRLGLFTMGGADYLSMRLHNMRLTRAVLAYCFESLGTQKSQDNKRQIVTDTDKEQHHESYKGRAKMIIPR